MLYYAVRVSRYLPYHRWEFAQLVVVSKPGKDDPHLSSSYRPISLRPAISKVLEKLIIYRLQPIIESRSFIPQHQFAFRRYHSTIEQVPTKHRISQMIRQSLEEKRYVQQPF